MKPTKTFLTEAEWLAARQQGIGGSDAAAAIGASRWKSPLELYAEKVGLVPEETEKQEQEILRWGKRLETPIRDAYVDETKRVVETLGLHQFVAENKFMTCTLDGLIVDVKEGVFESKCTAFHTEREILEEVPLDWQIQVQHNMATTGMEWGSLAILLNGRKLLWVDVQRDDKFIKVLIEKEAELWDRVMTRNPPPPSEPWESSLNALKTLYPEGKGSVKLDLMYIEVARELEQAKELKKKAEAKENEMKALMLAAIGDAEVGILPGGISYTLKTRKAYTVEKHDVKETRVLRRWEPKR